MNERTFEAVLVSLQNGSVPDGFLEAATYADDSLREYRRLMSAMTDCISRLWNSYRLHRKMLAAYKNREEKRLQDAGVRPLDAMERMELSHFLRLMAAEAAIAEESGVKDPQNLKKMRSVLLSRAADMIAAVNQETQNDKD